MVGLDLGALAVSNFLVHALGMGDESCRAAACSNFLADTLFGR